MTSFNELVKLIENDEIVQFWIEIASKDEKYIKAFISNKILDDRIADRLMFFLDSKHLKYGIAPNTDKIQALIQHFAFQNLNIKIIDLSDFASEQGLKSGISYSNSSLRKIVVSRLSLNYGEAELSAFIDNLINRFWLQLREFTVIIARIESITDDQITEIMAQILEYQCMYLLNGDDSIFKYFQMGYVFIKFENTVYIFYGSPNRREYLKNIVLGNPVNVLIKDLGADVIIEHGSGKLTEFAFEDESETLLTLRSSDKVSLIFSNDVGFRKYENLSSLSGIPCNIEVSFKRPGKIELQHGSNRQISRIQRLNKLLEQLISIIPAKILALDLENVSNSIDSDSIDLISQAVSLVTLNLSNAGVSADDLHQLRTLKNLRNLDISGVKFDSNRNNVLEFFPLLHKLVCKNTPEIIEVLRASETLPRLISLDLSENTINTNNYDSVPRLKYLQKLILKDTDFSEVEFFFLKNFPKLCELNLQNCNFSSNTLNSLNENISGLKLLDLSTDKSDMTLSVSDFMPISLIKNLEILSINNRMIDDEFLMNLITNSPSIRKLDVSFSILTNLGMSYIARLKRLNELKIIGCTRIDDNGANILCNSQLQLQKLDIRGTRITNTGLIKLSERFPKLSLNQFIS